MTVLGLGSSLLVIIIIIIIIINQVLRIIQIAVKSDVKTGGNYDVINKHG